MQDVAEAAGVSVGTVSNVLNHPAKVSPATAQRVREAIGRLGFVRNDAARSLVSGSTNSVGMVLADIENSLFIDMAHGAQDAARAVGQNLLLANTACDMTLQDDYLDLFDESRVTGVLLAPMQDSSAGIARIRSHGRQVVLLNYAPKPGTCCSVLVNNEHVGYLAARHLIDTGRTRLAYVVAHDEYQPVRDRRRGVRAAVEEAGPGVTLEEIDSVGLTSFHGHVVGQDVVAARARITQQPQALRAVAGRGQRGERPRIALRTPARIENLQGMRPARLQTRHIEAPEVPECVAGPPRHLAAVHQQHRRTAMRRPERRLDEESFVRRRGQ